MAKASAAKADEVRIEYVPLDEIERWPRNPKQHDVATLKESLTRFGFVAPIVMDDRLGRIVAGHGRLEALLALKAEGGEAPARVKVGKGGAWSAPVLRGVSFESEREAEAYLLADNRLVELGGWDEKGLTDMLANLEDVRGIGWSVDEVAGMLAPMTSAQDGDGEATRDLTPEEKQVVYTEADVKQVVLYFRGEDYAKVVTRLAKVSERNHCENNTEAVLFLLRHYEASSDSSDAT
jgi:hypothetical protein